jgi:hypothetical protein
LQDFLSIKPGCVRENICTFCKNLHPVPGFTRQAGNKIITREFSPGDLLFYGTRALSPGLVNFIKPTLVVGHPLGEYP